MSVSTESREKTSILRELDELMAYISNDSDADQQEDLIDLSFFIGNLEENTVAEVPTLTSVANETVKKQTRDQSLRQPGLFSSRMEQIRKAQEVQPEPSSEQVLADDNIERLVSALVAEHLPKIEAELRLKIRAQLEAKK